MTVCDSTRVDLFGFSYKGVTKSDITTQIRFAFISRLLNAPCFYLDISGVYSVSPDLGINWQTRAKRLTRDCKHGST